MLNVKCTDDLDICFLICLKNWNAENVSMHCGSMTWMSATITRVVQVSRWNTWKSFIIESEGEKPRVSEAQTSRVQLTFPSCPASVLSGIQPGWLHTLAVLSYAPVNRKWPSLAAPVKEGRSEGKKKGKKDTCEKNGLAFTGAVCRMWCKKSWLRWKRTADTRFWWEGTVYRHFLFLSSHTLQVLSPLPVAKWYLYAQRYIYSQYIKDQHKWTHRNHY